MAKQLLLLVTAPVLLFCARVSDAQQVPFVLDFSREASWRAVFDAGLRPKNIRGMDLLACEVRDCQVQILLPSGRQFETFATRMNLEVNGEDEISAISFVGRNVTLDESYNDFSKLAANLGATMPNLEAAISTARQTKSFEPLRPIQAAVRPHKDLDVRVHLIPGDLVRSTPQEDYVRVRIQLTWLAVSRRGRSRREPIKPPLGYEQYSMEPEPTTSALAAPVLSSSPVASQAVLSPPTAVGAPTAELSPAELSSSRVSNPAWWKLLLGGSAAVAVIVATITLWKRNRNRK